MGTRYQRTPNTQMKDALLQALAEVGGMDYLRRAEREGAHTFDAAKLAKFQKMLEGYTPHGR